MIGSGEATLDPSWTDVDWREHQRWVQLRGTPVNVIEMGEGEQAVVFIHGLSGSWQNWLEQIPSVVAFDLPGFGESPMPPSGDVSIAFYAEVVAELLAELGVREAAIVGNSMGGFIAMQLAITAPERVERLVLVGAAGISVVGEYSDRQLGVIRRADRWIAAYGAWLASKSDSLVRRPWLRRQLLGLVVAHPSRVSAPLAAEQLRGSGKPAFVEALADMVGFEIVDRLEAIDTPTLIVHGDRDKLVPVADADVFEEHIAGSRKLIYHDVGHTPQIEVPERFNRDVLEFVTG